MEKLKGYLKVKDGEITGIASTQAQDRDGEVILQSGWDLNNYMQNPVLMLMHNYQEFPVGKVTEIGVKDGKLQFTAIFSNATEKAKEAYALVKEGVLSAFSVGFIPRNYDGNTITEAELLEISLVPVPANPQAVVLAKQFQEKNEIARYIVKNFLVEDVKEAEPVVEAPKKEEAPEGMIAHVITQEDIDANPGIEADVKVGDEVFFPAPIKTEVVTPPAITPDVAPSDELGKESEKASEIDLKLIQATVGHLQILCRELKKKGGVNL